MIGRYEIKERMVKSVYLHGSFMTDNFGDFLLYDVTRRGVLTHFGQSLVLSRNVSPSYDRFTDVHRIRLREIGSVDCAIFTGGGYFGGPRGHVGNLLYTAEFVRYHLPAIAAVLAHRTPYAIVGVGVGPLRSRLLRAISRIFFARARTVMVRDDESRVYLANDLGLVRDVTVIPDLVYGSNHDLMPALASVCSDPSDDCLRIGVHLVTRRTRDDAHLNVIGGINQFSRSVTSARLEICMLCDQSGEKQTRRASERGRLLKYGDVRVFEYTSPWKLVSDIGRCDIVVTDKLHVGVVAMKLGIPVLSVASHPKTARFFRQLGRSRYCTPLYTAEARTIRNLLDELVAGRHRTAGRSVSTVESSAAAFVEAFTSISRTDR